MRIELWDSKLSTVSTVAVLGAILAGALHAAPAIAQFTSIGVAICSETTAVAAKACSEQAQANQNLSISMCDNLTHPAAATSCRKAAALQYLSDTQFCGQQVSARNKVCELIGQGAYDPPINPANFSTDISNPYLPMIPGTIFTYTVPNGLNILEVTSQTRVLMGVACLAVHDSFRSTAFRGKIRTITLPRTIRATFGTSARRPPSSTPAPACLQGSSGHGLPV